jgi:Tfp pilus assembly protein PilO
VAIRTGLEGKPWYYGLAAGVGVGAALFFLGYWQFIGPKKEEIEAAEGKLEGLQQQIQEGRAAKQQLPKFREEVRQLELELDKLLRILPARRNTPDLLRRIRALAEQGDFALKRFTPGQLTDQEFYSQWPIEVSIEGTYHNLAMFFDRISRFSRIINIEGLEISAIARPNDPHTIAASFKAKTFVYKEPAPATTEGGTAAGPAGAAAGKPGAAAGGPAARARRPAPAGGGGE